MHVELDQGLTEVEYKRGVVKVCRIGLTERSADSHFRSLPSGSW